MKKIANFSEFIRFFENGGYTIDGISFTNSDSSFERKKEVYRLLATKNQYGNTLLLEGVNIYGNLMTIKENIQ